MQGILGRVFWSLLLVSRSFHQVHPFVTLLASSGGQFGALGMASSGDSTDSKVEISSPEELSSLQTAVKNFRQAKGLKGIYRCASTDGLASSIEKGETIDELTEAERFLLYDAGLLIDLRSPSERDEERARLWMSQAPGGKFVVRNGGDENASERSVLRLDILSPTKLFDYLEENWLNPAQKGISALYFAVNVDKLHELRMEVLNQKGLAGLYEAIIETAASDLLLALQEITVHLEKRQENSGVVVHCVQGKDRTGLLVMLCQSIMGVSDQVIVSDYHLSDSIRKTGSAAMDSAGKRGPEKGKLDRQVFSGAPKQAMVETLAFIRSNYGSVSPGYLDAIGFDKGWRDRLVTAVGGNQDLRSKL